MNPIIVYVDDASYALPLVQALAASPQAQASHCAGRITPVLAKGPLAELVAQLQQEHGTAQIVDARRPKQEATAPAVAPAAPLGRRWNLPGTLAAIGALMGLVFEEAMI